MIHQYKSNGYNIVMDVNSGSVHVVDDIVYDMIPLVEPLVNEGIKDADTIKAAVLNLANIPYPDEDILEAVDEVLTLEAEGQLFAPDIYESYVFDFKKRQTVVKALCLHIAHDCNLACKYCFLGNNHQNTRMKFHKDNMTKDIAKKGADFFIQQLELQPLDESRDPSVIFYGGEPLINFEILEYIVLYLNSMKSAHPVLQNIDYSIVTNGLLLTEERLKRLVELGVSIGISVDGCDEEANQSRIDTNGNPVFHKIIETLDLIKSLGIPVSLSITLTEESIKNKEKMLDLIKKYEIKGFGFNIMMSDPNTKLAESYSHDAANFIIEIFQELRKLGIYEDRIMRKLKSFANAQVYFSDCAATSGAQIVIASNGDVGICHGCLADRKYFVQNITNENFNPQHDEVWNEWSKLSPINKPECQECEALGICGGGCPINAMNEKEGNDIHSLDKRFCIHAKTTLEFLISDLYRIITGKNERCLRESL